MSIFKSTTISKIIFQFDELTIIISKLDGCQAEDSDSCLQSSPGWGTYNCASSTIYCDSYAKDMKRCCPESCNSGVLTEDDCNGLSGYGTCIYPNDAQCVGNNENVKYIDRKINHILFRKISHKNL